MLLLASRITGTGRSPSPAKNFRAWLLSVLARTSVKCRFDDGYSSYCSNLHVRTDSMLLMWDVPIRSSTNWFVKCVAVLKRIRCHIMLLPRNHRLVLSFI